MKEILTKPGQSPAHGGLGIALIYAAVGALWIIFSDPALDLFFGQSRAAHIVQTLKGWFFVCASALLVYLLVSRTIASMKKCEKALMENQRTLSALFENLPGMLYRCGGDAECLLDFVSPGAVALTGYSISELSHKRKLGDLVLLEDREMVRSKTEEAFANRRPFKLIYRIRTADGGIKWVWELGLGVYSQKGELIATEGFLVDVTGQKRIEEALKRSDEVYKALAEGTSDAIFMVDGNRNIVSVNHAFLDLFGFSSEEIIGQSVRIVHPSDDSFTDFGKLASSVMEQGPIRVEWRLKKKDGTVFPVEGTFSVIDGPEGAIRGHVGIIRDITERKKADRELREYREHLEEMVLERTRELKQAQAALVQREKLKTLGATASEVAHEIRNPLVSIGGFARRLLKRYPESPEAEIILHETERLETMLNRLHDYLRPVSVKPRECHVNEILAASVGMLGPELEKNNVKVHLDLYPDMPTAHVDPAILTQVFVAMIRNAVEMMDLIKEVTLKTYFGEHNIYVDMISPVAGKKPWDPELMFLPFEEGVQGTGISSTFKLLKEMGGTLSFSKLDSKAIFTVSLVKCLEAGHDVIVQELQPG
ncbi:MAG: PAS domain S-box protein [Syntrophobacteraceae bacterium]